MAGGSTMASIAMAIAGFHYSIKRVSFKNKLIECK